MAESELVTHSISVPKSTGIDGFLHTVREILKLSRVQQIEITAAGKVTYKRVVVEGESYERIGVDYEGLEPWHTIRNAPEGVEELALGTYNAAIVLAGILDRASSEKLHPIAFVASPNSSLWLWYSHTTSFSLASRDSICGLPLHFDRHIPDSVLILCASYVRDGALVDTHKAYKIEMDYIIAPKTDVEVFNEPIGSTSSP